MLQNTENGKSVYFCNTSFKKQHTWK